MNNLIPARSVEEAIPNPMPDEYRVCLPSGCPRDDVTDVFIAINSVGHVDNNNTAVWRRLELMWHTQQVQADDQVGVTSQWRSTGVT